MKKMRFIRRIAAMVTALLIVISSAVAGSVQIGQTISSDSKWINSDIIGAIDENTPVSLRDDFHTAVNREWILNDETHEDGFERSEKLLAQRKLDIVMGNAPVDPANADAIGLSSEWLDHDLELVQTFASLAGEWEYRNELGVEPARPYLDAIAAISTMEEMTAYLTNENGMNLTGFSLINLTVADDPNGGKMQYLTVSPTQSFSLQDTDAYVYMGADARARHYVVENMTRYMMGRLGYEADAVDEVLTKGFLYEARLAEWVNVTEMRQTLKYMKSAKMLTPAEAAEITGNYPLMDILKAHGLEDQEQLAVYETKFLAQLDRYYQPRYLEEIKAMCMLHTVMELSDLLDEQTYDKFDEIWYIAYPAPKAEDEETEEELTEEELMAAFVFETYMDAYLPEPLEQIYVAAYCTPELKAEIRELIDQTIAFYGDMLMNVEWLSEEARAAAVEKLDNMAIHCVYPDTFTDYTGLVLAGYRDENPGTLPEAVAAIKAFNRAKTFETAGAPVDRDAWRMNTDMTATTVCNAYYNLMENSINIMAGILTEEFYDAEDSDEKKLGTIGMIIGHEITHAFDTTGYQFDKDGVNNPWWSTQDVEAFDLKARDLVKFYDNITPYPGALLYSGSVVSGEAIADMGGIKCMLSIAAQIPDFDYEEFFTSYAAMWRVQRGFEMEKQYANGDEHPLAFLRTNVTLQQFDEFIETFDIQPGDGMYLAPENRISVW